MVASTSAGATRIPRRPAPSGHGLLKQRMIALIGQQRAPLREQGRMLAQQPGDGLVQIVMIEQGGRQRAAGTDVHIDLGLTAVLDNEICSLMPTKCACAPGRQRLAQVRFAGQRNIARPRRAHKVTHAGPGLQTALRFRKRSTCKAVERLMSCRAISSQAACSPGFRLPNSMALL